jgi:ABC-type transporter MlaC component
MIWLKTSIQMMAIALVLAFSFAARAEEGSPTAVVDQLQAGIVEIMKAAEQLDVEARRARFVALLPSYLDQAYMARKSVGRSWKKLTPEQQGQLLDRFLQLSVAT